MHGLGIDFDRNRAHTQGLGKQPQKEDRYGVWEHGTHIKWFGKKTVDDINAKRYDFGQLFKN